MLPARLHLDIVAMEILGRVSFPSSTQKDFFSSLKKKCISLAALGFGAVSQVTDL